MKTLTECAMLPSVVRQLCSLGAGSGIDPVQFSEPADIAIGFNNYIMVSDGDGGINNRVLALDSGTLQVVYGIGGNGTGPGQFSSPHSIAYEERFNRFWVADRGNNRLQAFLAESGIWIGEWTCVLPGQPWGVRIDNVRNKMFVADGLNGALYALQMNYGPSRYQLGECQLLQNITVGTANTPHELDVDENTGDVYLAGVGTVPTIQRYYNASA
jgi:DNA-binding beta-propeller fold protein YncE